MLRHLALSTLCLTFAAAHAQDAPTPEFHVCTQADLERHVKVVYPTEGDRVCEVRYAKPTEGGGETAQWWASTPDNIGYCAQQATDFLERLANLGWSCEMRDEEPSEG